MREGQGIHCGSCIKRAKRGKPWDGCTGQSITVTGNWLSVPTVAKLPADACWVMRKTALSSRTPAARVSLGDRMGIWVGIVTCGYMASDKELGLFDLPQHQCATMAKVTKPVHVAFYSAEPT